MSDQDTNNNNQNIFDDGNNSSQQQQTNAQTNSATTNSTTANVGDNNQVVDNNTNNNTPDVNAIFKDHLSGIVDDSGEPKYKDVFTALEALKHSQDYIRTLQDENKTYRENNTKVDTMEEALRKLTADREQSQISTKSAELDVETVKGMTLEAVRQYEADKAAAANESSVSQELVKKYGDVEKAKEAYNKKAEELGVDTDTLRSLARTSPKAVLSYFSGGQESSAFDKNVNGSVNTDALGANQAQQPERVSKNIMHGGTREDMLNSWRASGQAALKDLENNN